MNDRKTIRPRRSFIFCPGIRPDLFEKALSPITLDVFSSISNTGAKFKSMPTAMSSEDINHAVSAKISISSSSFA